MHRALAAKARKMGMRPGTERYGAYVYGTMAKAEAKKKEPKKK
jgi:hypothetical protein